MAALHLEHKRILEELVEEYNARLEEYNGNLDDVKLHQQPTEEALKLLAAAFAMCMESANKGCAGGYWVEYCLWDVDAEFEKAFDELWPLV